MLKRYAAFRGETVKDCLKGFVFLLCIVAWQLYLLSLILADFKMSDLVPWCVMSAFWGFLIWACFIRKPKRK